MQNTYKKQKRVAIINDLSCYGRCSLAAALPILSAMGYESCPLPTALLSSSGAFHGYKKFDLTVPMHQIINHWKELKICFDGICTGLFFSSEQLELMQDFFCCFKKESTIVFVDPILGDHGKLYSVTTPGLCDGIRRILPYADILTPNLTECCSLLELPFPAVIPEEAELIKMAAGLSEFGPKKIVITGLTKGEEVFNFIYEKGRSPDYVKNKRIGKDRSGTGDVFSAILAGEILNQREFVQAVRIAASFLYDSILLTQDRGISEKHGICFEDFLKNT